MDDLHSYLVNEHQQGTVSPERLELMGKEAANLLMHEGVSLNESIAKLAGAEADINPEHVKRICEFANNAVYLAKHDQNKTAGASASYPRFTLADPNHVIQDLSDGARPKNLTPTDVDYGRLPERKEKVSSAESDDALAELFGMKTAEAMPEFSRESGVEDVMGAKSALIGLRDNLSNSAERFDLLRQEASENYYDSVKRHLLDGGGFEDVLHAAKSSGAPEGEVSRTLQPFVVRLLKEKVSSASALRCGVLGIEKVAHRVLNPEHPFVATFGALLSFDGELEKIATALEDIDARMSDVNAVIQEQCRGVSPR